MKQRNFVLPKMIALLVLMLCVVVVNSYSQSISSTFDADDEGWTVSGNSGSGDFGKNPGPEYFSSGGNPDGHIQIEDNKTGSFYAVVPSKFTGDLTAFVNGILEFDAMAVSGAISSSTERAEFGTVTIYGASDTVSLDITSSVPASAVFTKYSIELIATTWSKTDSEWLQLLSNVTSISILLEYSTDAIGDDRIAFDNFSISPSDNCYSASNSCMDSKVLMCHKFYSKCSGYKLHTICISKCAVDAHLKHGDSCGPCSESSNKMGDNAFSDYYVIEDEISVFPNPFNQYLNITYWEIEESENLEYKIVIFDNVGREVKVINRFKNETDGIDTGELSNGWYTFQILEHNTISKIGKLVKQ